MQRQSYQVKTVLEQKGARKETFLAFKDSLGNSLSRSPMSLGFDHHKTNTKASFTSTAIGRNMRGTEGSGSSVPTTEQIGDERTKDDY